MKDFLLTRGQLESYWADRRAIRPIKYLLIEPLALKLLNDSISNRPVEINSTDDIHPHHIKGIKSFAEHELWDENYGDFFIQFLMEKGYFTNKQRSYVFNNTERLILGIPNAEIGYEFKKMVTSFLTDPEEILKRLKEAVHELSFSDRQHAATESIVKVYPKSRGRGKPRKKRIGKY
ncbi:uncharacterized protein LOC128990305 [Macrosteles quadrilineatus]|uniref:uncharacterized protein LOC128990305 n=1 Tax=Macrosteles quadrilineatus TaxID=74068 RepID=UPI0023E21A28|nr:uncharacterized protein LOC128990305 [Macrosteles quadrilineatus]